ncbi:MAG: serine hydrolase [Ruminococcaceae bacterium]|nr:serine hydrolase [Oscillospiraceae bacterium]
MLFNKITPEQAGISSRHVTRFIKTLDRWGLVNHGVVLMKGNDIFAEYYWDPYDKDTVHRMYSQTKSYVGVAIGLLLEDGKLTLDDRIVDHFPEKRDGELKRFMEDLTIRDMLTMSTSGENPYWFTYGDPDRTHLYINQAGGQQPGGMRYRYDSSGSQVLSSLVEKLSGQSLFDFLNERIFRHLGTFKTATILKAPNGDSWGDSALVCTPRDMASFARFLMNYGTWDGKRLMSEAYLREATSAIVDNHETDAFDEFYTQGYGYQIWRLPENAFAFNGMGCQLTACLPDKDLTFVITSDNQGYAASKALILSAFYECIVDNLGEASLPEDPEAYAEALAIGDTLKLAVMSGKTTSPYAKELDGKVYVCEHTGTGITKFHFTFNEDGTGEWHYTNAQGDKVLPFGLGKNVFGKFPQLGYSDEYGVTPTTNGFMYDCAASAAWGNEQKLLLRVQVIDRYLGNMFAIFSFKDDCASITMRKTAEAFLNEYQGDWLAYREK